MSDAGSPSLEHPDYWWYRARSDLLEATLQDFVGASATRLRILDVGSADGPCVGWLRERGQRIGIDLDNRGLGVGDVQASAMDLPFAASSFDIVAAFDVIEHCEPEQRALAEIKRVLVPGGRLLMSVPAYEWAWTSHDEHNKHHRRYTKARAVAALSEEGFEVLRATYAFSATFPMFAVDRLRRRLSESRSGNHREHRPGSVATLPAVSRRTEQLLLALASAERRVLARRDLPFGSSVMVAAMKPTAHWPE